MSLHVGADRHIVIRMSSAYGKSRDLLVFEVTFQEEVRYRDQRLGDRRGVDSRCRGFQNG